MALWIRYMSVKSIITRPELTLSTEVSKLNRFNADSRMFDSDNNNRGEQVGGLAGF